MCVCSQVLIYDKNVMQTHSDKTSFLLFILPNSLRLGMSNLQKEHLVIHTCRDYYFGCLVIKCYLSTSDLCPL